MELRHLQAEQCPRISARDVHRLLMHAPSELALIDLRSVVEFGRVHVPHSINIPFATVLLGEQRLEALNVPHLETHLRGRIVVCVSNIHEHAVEVGPAALCPLFSRIQFLIAPLSVLSLFGGLRCDAHLYTTQGLQCPPLY